MEPSESESVGSPTTTIDPQLGSQREPSSPVPNHDHDPQSSDSDLNGKSGLKDGDETHELGGEFHDKLDLKDEGEGVGETEEKDSSVEAGGGELGGETEKKDSDFEAGGGELGGESGAPESGEGQASDDGSNGDERYVCNENVKESEVDKVSGDDDDNGVEGDEVEKQEDRSSGKQYPLRPEAEDCAFYLKTGTCKFGFNCKFNHPVGRRKNQVLLFVPLTLANYYYLTHMVALHV